MAESNGLGTGFAVRVVASDPALSRALASRLQREIEVPVSSDGTSGIGRGSIIITTPVDCPPARCRQIVDKGAIVLVVAALPKRLEEDAYRRSGAREYLPMLADGSNLAEAVREILRGEAGAAGVR